MSNTNDEAEDGGLQRMEVGRGTAVGEGGVVEELSLELLSKERYIG